MDALMLVAQSADVDLVRRLLEAGARTDVEDKLGRTALWYAAHAGALESARLLVQQGAGIDGADTAGITPLGVASATGSARWPLSAVEGRSQRRAFQEWRYAATSCHRWWHTAIVDNYSRLIVIRTRRTGLAIRSHDRLPQGGCGTRADASSGRCEHSRAQSRSIHGRDIAEARSFNKLAELLRERSRPARTAPASGGAPAL